MKRDKEDLKLVTNTHPHPDHAGGLEQIREVFYLKIATSHNFNTWYKGPQGFAKHKVETFLAGVTAYLKRIPAANLKYPNF